VIKDIFQIQYLEYVLNVQMELSHVMHLWQQDVNKDIIYKQVYANNVQIVKLIHVQILVKLIL